MVSPVTTAAYQPSASFIATQNKITPKLIAERATDGTFESLQIVGNSLFRGQDHKSRLSLVSYNLTDLTPETLFEVPEGGYDGISLLFADEKYVASYSTFGLGATSYIWHRENGQLITKVDCNRYFAQKGKTLLVNKTVKQENNQWPSLPALWDLSEGRFVGLLENAKPTHAFPKIEGDFIFLEQPNGVIGCWNSSDGSFVKTYGEERASARIHAIFVDQKTLIGVELDSIHIWDRETDQLVKTLTIPDPISKELHSYPENIYYKDDLLQINYFERMELWNIKNGEQIYCLNDLRLLTSDEDFHLFVNNRAEIEVRNRADGKLSMLLDGHPAHRPIDVTCRVSGNYIISSSEDGLKVWDKGEGGLMAVLSESPIKGLLVNQQKIIVQEGTNLKMWDLSVL